MSEFKPRQGQAEVLDYAGGRMGISAVPGSGKTRTLAELAARLVSTAIEDDQEVLVVTLVNSAVDNFRLTINRAMGQRELLPDLGYRVRTLHGLAHDIVREKPGLLGLSDDFGIIDEREAETVRRDAAEAWVHTHPTLLDRYLGADVEGGKAEWVRRAHWPKLVDSIASAFIKRAKDESLTPAVLLERLSMLEAGPGGRADLRSLALARMGTAIYADYQRSLAYRGVVDFDDLIRLALEALRLDAEYLARLQQKWPYVLEDEAQDSSSVQEQMLGLLAGESGNWVRVGDTNQAIYETFTTANPDLLRDFVDEEAVERVVLDQSGRSQQAILDLANYLVTWTCDDHSQHFAREKAFDRRSIRPTDRGDPQPNPPENATAVQLVDREFTPDAELEFVADSLERWLRRHQDRTVAVLVPRNQRGSELANLLQSRGIPYVEMLRSTNITRKTAGALGNLLRCLADPTSSRKLSQAFQVLFRHGRDDPEEEALMKTVSRQIAKCPAVESYLWPRADHDWLARLLPELSGEESALMEEFQNTARRWHRATTLPIDQLVLTLANDLFTEPSELALSYKLAVLLRDVAATHPSYRLPELVEELAVIARNERSFMGFASTDRGFQPPPGLVTITTMHKAKGLEWDQVYLMSVNNYDFPSGASHDSYMAERWFVRDSLNLEAEALAELDVLATMESGTEGQIPRLGEGEATQRARLEYVTERLRLLYVGITRARLGLIITWNTGRRPSERLQPAEPFRALYDFWEESRAYRVQP